MAASPEIARENGKKGGRPPGSLSKTTLEKKAALERFQARVRANIDPLFDSQLTLARGMSYLFRIDEEWEGKTKRKKHVLVTDPDEIIAYLDSQLDDVDDDGEQVYYYITTKDPDNHALDSLLDRTFGKAAQVIDHTGSVSIEDGDIRAMMTDLSPDDQQKFRETLAQFVAAAKSNREARTRSSDVGAETDLPQPAPDLPENVSPPDEMAPRTP